MTNSYLRAHEAKNRGQHTLAASLLRQAANELGAKRRFIEVYLGSDKSKAPGQPWTQEESLTWTQDPLTDWDNNLAVVDRAWGEQRG